MSLNSSKPSHSQGGFSMIEVLVTILVFAIGLLGVVSLQTTGMRLVHDSDMNSKAMMLASSMADKMRSNQAADTYIGIDATAANARDCETTTDPNQACSVAQEDVFEWNDQIAGFLPSGSGQVTQNGATYTISVSWLESADSNQSGRQRTYSLAVRI